MEEVEVVVVLVVGMVVEVVVMEEWLVLER